MKDYYKILQVAPDASTEVIQMAYKAVRFASQSVYVPFTSNV